MMLKEFDLLSKRDKKILEKEVEGVIRFFREKIDDPEKLALKMKEFQPIISFFIDFMIENRNGVTLREYRENMNKKNRKNNG